MNYSPVQHHHTQSREFQTARLSQRGIWISLMQYCTSQENNGIIKNISEWKPSEIRKTLNIDPATLRGPSPLWHMVGNDLHIYGYPHDKQAILNQKRRVLAENAGLQTVTQQPYKPKQPTSIPTAQAKTAQLTLPLGFMNFLRNTCVMDIWQDKKLNTVEEAAALQAYEQTITCKEYDWQMLAAYYQGYYKNGQTKDKYNNKYYCPASRLKLYENIIDVLTKAHLWAKDTRWKPKCQPSNSHPPPEHKNKAIPPPTEEIISLDEIQAAFSEMHRNLGSNPTTSK